MLKEILIGVLGNLIPMVMLGVGLMADPAKLRKQLTRRVVGTALGLLVAVPALAFGVVLPMHLSPQAVAVITLMAGSLGLPVLIRSVRVSGGNLGLAIDLSFLLSVGSALTLPLIVALLGRLDPSVLAVPLAPVAVRVALLILAPLAVGMLVRRLQPRVAEQGAVWLLRIFKATLLVAGVAAVAIGVPELLRVSWRAVGAAVLITLGSVALGELLAPRAPEDRTTVGLMAASGNPAVTLFVLGVAFPNLKAVPAVLAYLLLRTLLLLPYQRWARSHRAPAQDTALTSGHALRA